MTHWRAAFLTCNSALFTLNLGNTSPTNDPAWFGLRILDDVDGLSFGILGDNLTTEYRSFEVQPGVTLRQTLAVEKVNPEYDYTDVGLMLFSACEFDLYTNDGDLVNSDTIQIEVHYVPTCSDINVVTPKENWIINNSNNNQEVILFDGYDKDFLQFESVDVQYKHVNSPTWITLESYFLDPASQADPSMALELPDDNFSFVWNVSQVVDGEYEIRGITRCQQAEAPSEVLRGRLDRINPFAFGSPQPADGILDPNDEIVIEFNEAIFAGKLTALNFDIRGILNGSPIAHNSSVSFNGSNGFVRVPQGLNISNESFSIELWAKREARDIRQVLLSQGNNFSEALELGFGVDNTMFFSLNGNLVNTSNTVTDDDWHHYAFSYDKTNNRVSIFMDGDLQTIEPLRVDYVSQGELMIGRRNYITPNYFTGNIHEVRIWNTNIAQSDIVRRKSVALTGGEIGLIADWPMDEAFGTLIKEKVHRRNAILVADWEVMPSGYAIEFNGGNSLELEASTLALNQEMDFSVSFWFKGNDGANQTFFSNGKGDGTDANPHGWSIYSDAEGKIWVDNNGISFQATDRSYFDDMWHNFAFVVRRTGNTTSFIDGAQQEMTNSDRWSQFGGAKIALGSRYWRTGTTEMRDNYFTGRMDEFRLWNVARKQEQIARDMNGRLQGDEVGLIAYFPFEAYADDAGVQVLRSSDTDQSISGVLAVNRGVNFTNQSANIILGRPVEKVLFTHGVNVDGNRIILDIQENPTRVEGAVLDISVRNVEDLFGNKMQSPETWTAFVNRRQFRWIEENLDFEKEVNSELSFEATIRNSSGQQQAYDVTNLPVWLVASPASGTLGPLASQKIMFTVNPGLNIGTYNPDVYLTTNDYTDKLSINVKVDAETPVWEVNPADFANTMSITAQLQIDGVFSFDPEDMVAAVVGDEIRGVAQPVYEEVFDTYLLYLNVFSNVQAGEEIQFMVFDASEGRIHTRTSIIPEQKIAFQTSDIIGKPDQPIVINAERIFERSIELNEGWNWVSFNLLSPDLGNVNTLLETIVSSNGDVLKNSSSFDQYSSRTGWVGSLSANGGATNTSAYLLRTSRDQDLLIYGKEIDPESIEMTINEGWNWISFIPQVNMDINDALAGLTLKSGDALVSQTGFAIYYENRGWLGSLKTLQPGKGYMLSSSVSGTFKYPREGVLSSSSNRRINQLADTELNPYDFESNMSVVAEIVNEFDAEIEIKAYANGKIVGKANTTFIEGQKQPIYFIQLYGNQSETEVSFKAFKGNKVIGESITKINFSPLTLQGNLEEPVSLLFNEKDSGANLNLTKSLETTPNPVVTQSMISFGLSKNSEVKLSITDASGQLVALLIDSEDLAKGDYEYTIQADNFATGVYHVTLTKGSEIETLEIIID